MTVTIPALSNKCACSIENRNKGESQHDWLKRCLCSYHWIQSDYGKREIELSEVLEKREEARLKRRAKANKKHG